MALNFRAIRLVIWPLQMWKWSFPPLWNRLPGVSDRPSYEGQILCATYPLIGNYGVPEAIKVGGVQQHFESDRIHVRGLIISDYSLKYSHWSAIKSLDQWLRENRIPAIYGVDTRELTKVIRDNGSSEE